MHTFWSRNLEGIGHLEDKGIDGKIIPEWILREVGWEGVDCIHLVWYKDQ